MGDMTLGNNWSRQAYGDFERLFIAWLDRNQYELDEAGTGDMRNLAALCAAWAEKNIELTVVSEPRAGHPLNEDER